VGDGVPCCAGIGERFGKTAAAMKVAVHRMRQRYREVLRTIVAETVDDEREVDDEPRFLLPIALSDSSASQLNHPYIEPTGGGTRLHLEFQKRRVNNRHCSSRRR
jgi:hypothetical protein